MIALLGNHRKKGVVGKRPRSALHRSGESARWTPEGNVFLLDGQNGSANRAASVSGSRSRLAPWQPKTLAERSSDGKESVLDEKGDLMLFNIDSDKPIDHVPYQEKFDKLRQRLTKDEFDAMVTEINRLINRDGGEIATAGWLPGSDWTGTPFEAIYTKAARLDFEGSALFFGQLVWYTIMQRPEHWASGRYEKDGKDIGSRTCFKLKEQ